MATIRKKLFLYVSIRYRHSNSITLVRQDHTALQDSLCDAESCPTVYIWHTVALFKSCLLFLSTTDKPTIHGQLQRQNAKCVIYDELLIQMRNISLLLTAFISLVHIGTIGPQGVQTFATCNAIDHGLKLKAPSIITCSPRGNDRDNSTQLYRSDAKSAICNMQ